MSTRTVVPTSSADLYSDEEILSPYETYRALRDAGPAVWLEQHNVWSLARYHDVYEALHNHELFRRKSAATHLAFGHGVHACLGMGLARLEGHALLTALTAKVRTLEVGQPTWRLNNTIRSLGSLPVTVRA